MRTNKFTEELRTIYKTDGTISTLFPKNLQELFGMNSEQSITAPRQLNIADDDLQFVAAETARRLLDEYGMWDGTKSRERNLNHFMQFCGVNYQLVGEDRPRCSCSGRLY